MSDTIKDVKDDDMKIKRVKTQFKRVIDPYPDYSDFSDADMGL
jgi:hypothetical protein